MCLIDTCQLLVRETAAVQWKTHNAQHCMPEFKPEPSESWHAVVCSMCLLLMFKMSASHRIITCQTIYDALCGEAGELGNWGWLGVSPHNCLVLMFFKEYFPQDIYL